MKQFEEDLGPDRMIGIETDDEENEAERVCHDQGDDTESDMSALSRNPSRDECAGDPSPHWPQSYRQSMDMYTGLTPPPVSFLRGSSFLTSPDQRESSLTKPLLPSTTLDHESPSAPISKIPSNRSVVSHQRISFAEIPPSKKCSYSQSLLNAINALCGIGILSTPYALKQGGWFSLLLLLLFGVVTCYTGILLKRCLQSSPSLRAYPDIGQAAFGISGRICISAILYMELYSSCVEFLIMMSDNLSAILPNAQMEVGGIHLSSYQVCAIGSALVILPTVWLRDLSLLSYISVGGVVNLFLVVICLLWVGVTSETGFNPTSNALDLSRLPITIGIYSFCYGSHSVFPNIYSSMKDPSLFPSVLTISFLVAGLLYSGVAVFGYYMFGEATKPQFTLNLPTQLLASNIAGWSMVVAPVTKFALSMTPVALGIEELLPSARLKSHGCSVLVRTCLMLSTLIVALTVPYFGSVMALIGSILVMLVSVILPCACYMRIHKGRMTKLQIGICTTIMCVGGICAVVGTYSAIASMADD